MLIPVNLRVDCASLCGEASDRIVASEKPNLSWGGYTDIENNFQTAYRVVVKEKDNVLWDSGMVKSAVSSVKYSGKPLPAGRRITYSVSVAGNDGLLSPETSEYFYVGTPDNLPIVKWICASDDKESVPVYFKKEFSLERSVDNAVLFVSGAGYCNVSLNGINVGLSGLNPALTDYTKTCYYSVIPEVQHCLSEGQNNISIVLADGWRRNWGDYLKIYNNSPGFFGTPCLWAALKITYTDGSESWLTTDETWSWSRGKIIFSHLFDGETYDDGADIAGDYPVCLYDGNIGKLRVMTVPAVKEHKVFKPVDIYSREPGKYIVDFGTNLSGVVRIRIPCGMKKGNKIIIRHGQIVNPDGSLNVDTLRGAKSEDTYISSGSDSNDFWQPVFTCHGFRYAEITGYPLLRKEDISAVMLCTDIESRLYFNSGSPVANAIHSMLVQTERSTIHGACNDTCGRSERMHWLDDGVLRYPEVAFNFEIGKLFPHMLMLIRDTQEQDGSITCTAPHIYGKRPGDPLSSSYLMLAEELYARCQNTEILREYYPSFCAWEKCLLDNSQDYIMNYSYYGDWAGPEYSRDANSIGGGAGSATIPAIMVGTGFLMHNARLLESFARILGKKDDEKYYRELYGKVRNAFRDKWYDASSKKVYNGSQSCQALALWLGVIPEEDRECVARIMRNDLVKSGYRFTTGAFCLKFMCEMLIEYGYVDEFYELMTREEYPSLGYMIQHGATTGWEKYEYLTGSGMNAHTHALQVSVFQCFYKYIAGISVVGDNGTTIDINPHYPRKLNTLHMIHTTVRGDVSVNWKRVENTINLKVNIPFNTKANIHTPDGIKTVGSGFYTFEWVENDERKQENE